ncbi:hypothetical protein C8R47DRAFT_1229411 [Mycena vitilis]|nr:hypothetical protein C8R47DRAFT_1229411 [Mycena vitilis]
MPPHLAELSAKTIQIHATELADDFSLTTDGFLPMSPEQHAKALSAIQFYALAAQVDVPSGKFADAIVQNFAARFLPSLISAFRACPGSGDSYASALVILLASPYFIRFVRRTASGYTLLIFHVNRMIKQGLLILSGPSSHNRALINSVVILDFLTFYAASFPRHVLCPSKTSVDHLFGWLGNITAQCDVLLDDLEQSDRIPVQEFRTICLKAHKNMESLMKKEGSTAKMSDLPWFACNAFEEQFLQKPCSTKNSKQMKQCSRCRATKYCCKDQQKLDWPADPEVSTWDDIVQAGVNAEVLVTTGLGQKNDRELSETEHQSQEDNESGEDDDDDADAPAGDEEEMPSAQWRGGHVDTPQTRGQTLRVAAVDVPEHDNRSQADSQSQRRHDEYMRKGLCFNCSGSGHLGRDFPVSA